MSRGLRRGAALAVGVLLAGCAGTRIADGVYHSPEGWRVTLPGGGWRVEEGRANLELRHADGTAGILANAVCEPAVTRRSLPLLRRHLLAAITDREIVEEDEAPVNGHPAAHVVVTGRHREGGAPVRLEAFVVKDARCVYDFVLAASPEHFERKRMEFHRLVESFRTE